MIRLMSAADDVMIRLWLMSAADDVMIRLMSAADVVMRVRY